MGNSRITYIDSLRGLAIILVVMGHALEFNGYQESLLYSIIYSFHMPLFFCISGFVTMYACKLEHNSKTLDYGKYIWRKFLSIMLPCLVCSLIVNPFFFAKSFDMSAFEWAVKAQLIENGGYWFLPCLFNLLIIFTVWKIIVDRLKNSYVAIDVVLLLVILGGAFFLSSITSIDYLRSVSSYFVPFFLGVMMGRYGYLRDLVVDNKSLYAICFIAYCLGVGFFAGNAPGVINKILRLTLGVLAIPVLFHFFAHVTFYKPIEKVMSLLGKYTLIIYLIHYFFVKDIPVPGDMGIWSQIVVLGGISVLVCITAIVVAKMMELSSFMSFCMLGKINKKVN